MSKEWIKEAGKLTNGQDPAVEQMKRIRQQLAIALNNRDWRLVAQLDRLSAQLVTRLDPQKSEVMGELAIELRKIKALYQRSITLIDRALSEYSNQAY